MVLMLAVRFIFFFILLSEAIVHGFHISSFHGSNVAYGPGKKTAPGQCLRMGMQVKIRIVGRKNGCEKWLEDAYSMYETRLRSSNLEVATIWHKSNQDLVKNVIGDKDKGHSIVLLDPLGKTKTSEQFSESLYDLLNIGGSRLSFVIGGAEGLPNELRYPEDGPKPNMVSLSALTFTHQFARTLLMEQIYRASEIRKGSGYHK